MSPMTFSQQVITIALCVLGTVTTRFLPFLVFAGKRETPAIVQYLGKALPSAICLPQFTQNIVNPLLSCFCRNANWIITYTKTFVNPARTYLFLRSMRSAPGKVDRRTRKDEKA